jgi:hypothetical protein
MAFHLLHPNKASSVPKSGEALRGWKNITFCLAQESSH